MSKYIKFLDKKSGLISDAGFLLLFTGDAVSGQNQHLLTLSYCRGNSVLQMMGSRPICRENSNLELPMVGKRRES